MTEGIVPTEEDIVAEELAFLQDVISEIESSIAMAAVRMKTIPPSRIEIEPRRPAVAAIIRQDVGPPLLLRWLRNLSLFIGFGPSSVFPSTLLRVFRAGKLITSPEAWELTAIIPRCKAGAGPEVIAPRFIVI